MSLPKSVCITGGSGFVGSHLVDKLLALGVWVTVYDNRTTGQNHFLHGASEHEHFRFITGDVLDHSLLEHTLINHEAVVHLSANADIRHGAEYPLRDFEQNVAGTQSVLEAMRHQSVKRIYFASTGSVYGNARVIPTPENCPFPRQTSLYGASKLAAEGLITAYSETFGFDGAIFRFTPMIGERYSHGHLFDFVKKLQRVPDSIEILGNGSERKYCVYVGDAVDAMVLLMSSPKARLPIVNVANDDSYTIDQAVDWVSETMGISPKKTYTYQTWAGDNPDMHLSTSLLRAQGWEPRVNLKTAVQRTVRYLLDNPWLMVART